MSINSNKRTQKPFINPIQVYVAVKKHRLDIARSNYPLVYIMPSH